MSWSPIGTLVGDPVQATDPDGDVLSYTRPRRLFHGAAFTIDQQTGQLRTALELDYEYFARLIVAVRVTDPSGAAALTYLNIDIVDVDEPPIVSGPRAVDVGAGSTAPIASFEVSDPEGDPIVWSLAGDDAQRFRIDDGRLSFVAPPSFERPADAGADNVYDIVVAVSDGEFSDEITVAVTVTERLTPRRANPIGGCFLNSRQPGPQCAGIAGLDKSQHRAADISRCVASDPWPDP
ncbi:cadherin domain-containing protein [Candidatus Poriferisodalis sp.]|uniref:cadherin repeat domain-containing protein n=1 Tax=Candidatus Poriferisodalis sp. TaxID=3101277 RepID=UPI003B5B0A5B